MEDAQVLDRTLLECGNDIDVAIKMLEKLCLGASATAADETPEDDSVAGNLPVDGAGWVDSFLMEMMKATNMEDAKVRASKLVDDLEKSITKRAGEEALREIGALHRQNSILKRAVAIQHERHKKEQLEVEYLKQLISQSQERLKTLEIGNYALAMHLRQAHKSNSLPRFHPDVC